MAFSSLVSQNCLARHSGTTAEELNAPLGGGCNTFASSAPISRALYVLAMNANPQTELNAGADRKGLSVGIAVALAAALIGLALGAGIGLVTRHGGDSARLAVAPAQVAGKPSDGDLPALRATAPLPTLRRSVSVLPKRTVSIAAAAVPTSRNAVSRAPSNTGSAPAVSAPSSATTPSRATSTTPSSSGGGLTRASGGGE